MGGKKDKNDRRQKDKDRGRERERGETKRRRGFPVFLVNRPSGARAARYALDTVSTYLL